ncbi:MAG: DUF6259 domain-containing protein, partial [Planctomycetia bacterium]|nr:DUF6259 domain-containing protein [Planctomycetia bacterium]
MSKRMFLFLFLLFSIPITASADLNEIASIKNDKIEVGIDARGNLQVLKNLKTGHNYAGGSALWRLYFDRKDGQKENVITGSENRPKISMKNNSIQLDYDQLHCGEESLRYSLSLEIRLEGELVRFSSVIKNEEEHTIVRELQYPLVGDLSMVPDQKLLSTHLGGFTYQNPVDYVVRVGNAPPYMGPGQIMREYQVKYPSHTMSNCSALIGSKEGLYIGSHDLTFQDTIHGFRVWPDKNREFNRFEIGLYKYPNCTCGKEWKCDANVLAPYCGDWHETSRIYRKWADTWWSKRPTPDWIKKMTGWQRLIFRHQYGETFFKYTDLNGKIKNAGFDAGVKTVLAFGWWNSGMDNGYPDSYFITDPKQGGDQAWKKEIAKYQADGGRLLLYYNGKLIDRTSPFYRSGAANDLIFHDNTGGEHLEAYRFSGTGTFTKNHNSRSFVVADTRTKIWRQWLVRMLQRGLDFNVDGIFYDQLGYAEDMSTWDNTGEFPIPNLCLIKDKADTLKMLHDYLDVHADPHVALGTENLADVVAQHVDYIHALSGAYGGGHLIDWTRFTFPEVVFSDRDLRDDTDAVNRVN